MDNQFEPLATGEVLSVGESTKFLIGHRTFRVGELSEAIRVQLEQGINGWSQEKNAWFSEAGIPCEVLRFTANGWQKGKVRINLEFCPQDITLEEEPLASFDNVASTVPPTTTVDELDLGEPALSSASFDDELTVAAVASSAAALDVIELPSTSMVDELDLGEPPTSMVDELDLGEPAISVVELDLGEPPTSLEDEFDLETPIASDFALEQEAPDAIYIEMEQEVSVFIPENEPDIAQSDTSLDDDFDLGEISDSIEQELELVQAPTASDDEFDLGELSLQGDDNLDFGAMSSEGDDLDLGDLSSPNDDDLDFGAMSMGSDDDFQLEELSLNDDSEDDETDSLLDDVWQDMNQASWKNNPS